MTVAEALTNRGLEVSPAFVSTVKDTMALTTPSSDSEDDLLVKLGKAQVDAMFRRQDDYAVDDSALTYAILCNWRVNGD